MHDAGKENKEYNVINDEIEDIDSDQDSDYPYQHEAPPQQNNSKVPGLALGGLGNSGAPKMGGLGLNLGAVQKMEEPKAEKTIPQGFAIKMPVNKQQDKIPSLNIGLTQNNRSDEVMNSGSHSSKRDGVGRLNLDKAVAY